MQFGLTFRLTDEPPESIRKGHMWMAHIMAGNCSFGAVYCHAIDGKYSALWSFKETQYIEATGATPQEAVSNAMREWLSRMFAPEV